jgi:hypothetical protein
MRLKKIEEMVGQKGQSFRCTSCEDALALVMWMGIGVEADNTKGGYSGKPKLVKGEIYLCKACAVDICLGLLRDVMEIEEGNGQKAPFQVLEELSQLFSRT